MANDLIKVTDIEFPTIKDRSDHVTSLIAGRQNIDAKLFEAITILNDQISRITLAISPIVKVLSQRSISAILLVPPINLGYSIQRISIRLFWTRPDLSGIFSYELRFGGADWETADYVLRTQSTQVDVAPFVGLIGLYRVKTMNDLGQYSAEEASVTVIVTAPAAPSVTAQVIDNNVMLNWTIPAASYEIHHYILRRGESEIAQLTGNFTVWFEMIGGVYTYSVEAVDIAGNIGAPGIVSATLTTPSDFILEAVRVSTLGAYSSGPPHYVYLQEFAIFGDVNYRYSARPGFEVADPHFYFMELTVSSTLYQVLRMPGPMLLCCWVAHTWQVHFTNRSWLTPKNQVDAGYPIYIQPAVLDGYYEETYDYGAIFENNIVTVTWTERSVTAGGMTTIVKMAVSNDGITYTPYTVGATQFFESIRYMKLKLEFTLENDKALVELSNLTISLSVKKELDSGIVDALAGDIGGTQVFFNKKFKDVDSITLAVESKEPVTAIYDFLDQPNPTYFKVFALDSSGNRVSYPMSWKARGVI